MRSAECGMRNFSEGSFATRDSHLHSAFRIPHSALRVGWGRGKFVSWVAATRARPGEAVIVQPGEEGAFLSSQPLAALSLDPDTHRRLRQLGLTTLGRLAALPQEAVVSQFGAAGRSEEHTSELQSPCNLVCRLLLEKKKLDTVSHLL